MEYNFNSLSKSTKTLNPKILSQNLPQKITKIIHKIKEFDSNTTIDTNILTNNNFTKKIFTIRPDKK